MPAPDALPAELFAYGPVPGVELIPYFLALLAWIGLALGALILSPFTAVIRRLRRLRGAPPTEPKSEQPTEPVQLPAAPAPPTTPPTPEPSVEGPRDHA